MRSFCCDPPPELPDIQRSVSKEYTVTVITPMFGGGFDASENDSEMLIRSTSIRGHLRFWWRATRGKTFGSVSEMREAENAIWGSTDIPSKVSVKVKIKRYGNSVAYADVKPKDLRNNIENKLPYLLFPFQENRREGKTAKSGTNGIEFELQLDFPEALRLDVEAAVWAWVNFGGIGARTRRGCGSLYCKEFAPPNHNGITQWFNDALKKYDIKNKPATSWSTLGNSFLYENTNTDALNVWNQLASIYRKFRQGENVGRNSGQQHNRPGRSRWSEAETIRDITHQAANAHRPPYVQPRQNAFPRAEFGLPIIVHFQGGGEPADMEINHPNGDRMGSPLILRPLKMQDNNVIPIVLRLQTELLEAAILKQVNAPKATIAENVPVVIPTLAKNWDQSPLYQRTQTGSALDAFHAFLLEQHYTEVQR